MKKVFSPEFEKFRRERYDLPPADPIWNPNGFRADYTQPGNSEMSAHIPILEYFASHCDHITEFGTRLCNSLAAFLSGCKPSGRVVSYDIQVWEPIQELINMRSQGLLPADWAFKLESSVNPYHTIEETDLLMCDTMHNYFQLKRELELHANKVRRWIVFHDVFTCAYKALDSGDILGIYPAIEEFLANHLEFEKIYEVPWNHGLLIIERH